MSTVVQDNRVSESRVIGRSKGGDLTWTFSVEHVQVPEPSNHGIKSTAKTRLRISCDNEALWWVRPCVVKGLVQ